MIGPGSIIRRAIGAVVLALIASAGVCGETDVMQLRLLEPYSMPLRWDNVEDEPYWVNGVSPHDNRDWNMETVTLSPNRWVTVLLPAYQTLRLFRPDQKLDAGTIEVYSSAGSGLNVKQTLEASEDGHSLLLSPQSDQPLVVRIEKSCCRLGDAEFAMFVSRTEPLNDISPYRDLMLSPAKWCLLGQRPLTPPELYNHLSARSAHRFDVRGPARILLKSRLEYEKEAADVLQNFRFQYWFDGDEARKQTRTISTEAEKRRVITVNGSVIVAGREEQSFIEVPSGSHRLYLQSDRPNYVQLLAQTEHDYLFEGLNKPELSVAQIRKRGILARSELHAAEEKAKALARDNSRRSAGLAAGNLLRDAAAKRRDYPHGITEAEYFSRAATFYRDLMPSKKAETADQYMAYFMPESLQGINKPDRHAVLAEQLVGDALKHLSQGFFTTLKRPGNAGGNEYVLPEQQTEGELRIAIDKSICHQDYLHIEIDRDNYYDLRLDCPSEIGQDGKVRALGEAALLTAQQKFFDKRPTLNSYFAAYSEPAKLIPAAVYELPLPASARTLKVWRSSSAEQSMPVALQYRTGRSYALTEQSYLYLLNNFSASANGRRFLIEYLSQSGGNGPAIHAASLNQIDDKQLINQWAALKRLLVSEFNLYRASISDAEIQTETETDSTQAGKFIALAQKSEDKQLWLDALEYWSEAANRTAGLTHSRAQFHQALMLKKLGEDYLADNLFRYLTLHADEEVAENSVGELNRAYQVQQNDAGLLMLSATIFLHRPDDAHAKQLLTALLANGEYRFALLFGLAYGNSIPAEGLLTAAYRLEWWETFDHLMDKQPPEQRQFWIGLKAQHSGNFDGALTAWQSMAEKKWRDYLQQGLQLQEALTHSPANAGQTMYEQWAIWQQKNPGPRVWESALWHIKDYAAYDTYYSIERDIYSQGFRAEPARPGVLKLLGPATLNFQIRPMHRLDQSERALDGWVDIEDNGSNYRYPFLNNTRSQGIQVIGAQNLQVGSLVNLTYRVGLGMHEIKLSSAQAPLSISVQEQRPELAINVLPPLTAETWAAMFSAALPERAALGTSP